MAMVVFMVPASLSRVGQLAPKVLFHHDIRCAAATSDYTDSVGGKHLKGALSHIAGQHQGYALLPEDVCNIRLAATSFRRLKNVAAKNTFIVVGINGIEFTMAEMVIYLVTPCGYCCFV